MRHFIPVLIVIALQHPANSSLVQNGQIPSLMNFGNGTKNQDIHPKVISTNTVPVIIEAASSDENQKKLDLIQNPHPTTVMSSSAEKGQSGRRRKLKKAKKNRQRENKKPVMYGSEAFSEEELGDIFNNFDQSGLDSYNYSMDTLFETDKFVEELELDLTKKERFRIIKMIEELDLDGLKQLRDSARKTTTSTHAPVSTTPILTTLIDQKETIEKAIEDLSEKSREIQFETVPSTLVEKTSPITTEEPVDVEKSSFPFNSIIWTNINIICALSLVAFIAIIVLFAVAFKLMRKMKQNEAEAN
ncbi:hypothetical protein CRE_27612 [Caenorhabditis remanei]|uniref:Uncharacterized protein n=1 Tax=Caenorhabditis remanei TaxID=31234 RepID=E3MKI2_CAERE|nr:hypothetical protein CRE_27612 [Caenorhabditis remanei]